MTIDSSDSCLVNVRVCLYNVHSVATTPSVRALRPRDLRIYGNTDFTWEVSYGMTFATLAHVLMDLTSGGGGGGDDADEGDISLSGATFRVLGTQLACRVLARPELDDDIWQFADLRSGRMGIVLHVKNA